jgi:hypothetical protein
VLQSFADWLAQEVPRILPKSKIGEAVGYAANQWPTLNRYLEDGDSQSTTPRPSKRSVRWPSVAATGCRSPAMEGCAAPPSIAASAKRYGVNPWLSVRHLLAELAAGKPNADFSDLLPDAWTQAGAELVSAPTPSGPWTLPSRQTARARPCLTASVTTGPIAAILCWGR